MKKRIVPLIAAVGVLGSLAAAGTVLKMKRRSRIRMEKKRPEGSKPARTNIEVEA